MMKACKCGSYAINHNCHGRDGSDDDLCDVCYWRKRAEQPAQTDWEAVAADQAMTIALLKAEQPAQRTWVGLTDEDIRQCSRDVVAGGKENSVDRFAYAIEAKLKEKNT